METILITGGNRGIGLALVKRYLSNDFQVLTTCRKSSPELNELKKEGDLKILENFDVTSSKSYELLNDFLKDIKLNILFHNAGILHEGSFEKVTPESLRDQFEVNALAPLFLTKALTPFLQGGSKIGILTSRMGSIGDNGSGGQYGYRMSKAAANAMGKSLAHDLLDQKIAVAILHPGFVKTEMTNQGGSLTPEEAAQGLFRRMDGLNLENSGTFWHSNGEVLPW